DRQRVYRRQATTGGRVVGFSPDGTLAVSSTGDTTLEIWRVADGMPAGPPLTHESKIFSAALSPDGKTALIGGMDHMARLWRVADGSPVGQPMKHCYTGVLVHDGGRTWRALPGVLSRVAFSPDGTLVLTSGGDSTVRVWDATRGLPQGKPIEYPSFCSFSSVAFSPDGKTILVAIRGSRGSGDVTQAQAQPWRVADCAPVGKPLIRLDTINAVAFSPDGKLILTGGSDFAGGSKGTARLWRASDGMP